MKTCKNCNEFESTHIGRARACFGGMGTVFTPLEDAPVRSARTPLRIGDIRVMSDRKQNDPQDMHWSIFDSESGVVAHVSKREYAELIVRAVNHHAALTEALQYALDYPMALSTNEGFIADVRATLQSVREGKL